MLMLSACSWRPGRFPRTALVEVRRNHRPVQGECMLNRQSWNAIRILLVALTACGCAFAQYGGGTTGGGTGATGGTGGYTPSGRSYGHGAAIGAGVGAAAGGTVLFLALRHRHHQVVGCVSPDGKTLTADKDKHAYQLAGAPMTAGEHLS